MNVKYLWISCRNVVLPQYQGFSISRIIGDIIFQWYKDKHQRIRETMSHPQRIKSLIKNKKWICVRAGRVAKLGKTSKIKNKINSCNRLTCTFEFIGDKNLKGEIFNVQ